MEKQTVIIIIVVIIAAAFIGIGGYLAFSYSKSDNNEDNPNKPGDGDNKNCDTCGPKCNQCRCDPNCNENDPNCIKCEPDCTKCPPDCPKCPADCAKCAGVCPPDCTKCIGPPRDKLLSNISNFTRLPSPFYPQDKELKSVTDYRAVLADNGDLNIYNPTNKLVWTTPIIGDRGPPPYHVDMQEDGNFCLYSSTKPYWCSGTVGKEKPPYMAIMQADGNFCVYGSGNKHTWCSSTAGK